MAATLPVPITFKLPDGWRSAHPDSVGAPGVSFVAVDSQSDANFTANISIAGELRPDEVSLSVIADESVHRMRAVAESVEVADRREVGSADAPGLTQTMRFSAVAAGTRRDLVQSQVYLSLRGADDPDERAVLQLTLTATASQHESVVQDFQDFVRSVRPETEGTTS
ncbi:hypothetical protein ACFYMO_30615 [Streptomyces sp. NPDC007025]|uniref:hypothetical protein n=1 Tax=Streptomyces sp. NPDC007025 TaxID=3364771 RepID=UPI0036CF970F